MKQREKEQTVINEKKVKFLLLQPYCLVIELFASAKLIASNFKETTGNYDLIVFILSIILL